MKRSFKVFWSFKFNDKETGNYSTVVAHSQQEAMAIVASQNHLMWIIRVEEI